MKAEKFYDKKGNMIAPQDKNVQACLYANFLKAFLFINYSDCSGYDNCYNLEDYVT